LIKARWSHCNDIKSAIEEIMLQGNNTEITVKKYTSSSKKGAKDRRFIADAIYSIIKNYRFYEFISPTSNHPINGIIAAYFYQNNILPPEQEDWNIIEATKIEELKKLALTMPEVKFSVPQWLHDLGIKSLPDNWINIIKASILKAPIFIRVNNLKTNFRKLSNYFNKNNIQHKVENEHCIRLLDRMNLSQNKAFSDGWFEIQDLGSQQIAHFCNPRPGDFVIEACCGAGGKTLHLADLMENSGTIMALDVNNKAQEALKQRAQRASISIINIADYSDKDRLNLLIHTAQIVLCDVPCSATGVMRREIDQKWKLTPDKLQSLIDLQYQILVQSSKWVMVDGFLVYATCSVLPVENKDQITRFLELNPNFIFVEEKTLYPTEDGHDGFYMCKMRRIQ